MARKPTGKPTGRPPKDYNRQVFEGLCQIQCTINEIESVLHADQRSIDNWCKREYGEDFSTIYKRFSEGGKASLRRMQLNLAKTNASMCIWLGKQYLGQKDPDNKDQSLDPETVGKFNAIMNQIDSLQSSRKIEESSKRADKKS
ncbi:MAG: hypothetical protein ACSNEK_10035 [Parachlamydiaceae bacterium]